MAKNEDKPVLHVEIGDDTVSEEQPKQPTPIIETEPTPAKEETSAATAEAPAAATPKEEGCLKRANAWLEDSFPTHKNAVLGGAVGLIVALMIFGIGFWKTLFISVLILIGVAVGQIADGDPKLIRLIKELIKKH